MPPKIHCHICLGSFHISRILTYPCGHGFCIDCVEISHRKSNVTCAMCREKVDRNKARPIYLDLVDSARSDAETTVEGLAKMDADTKKISLQRGATRIQKAIETLNCDNDIAHSLQQALDDFRTRIIPCFSKVEEQNEEIIALRDRLLRAQRNVKSLQNVETESLKKDEALVGLRADLKHVEKDRDQAVSFAETLSGKVIQLRQGNESAKEKMEKLENENQRLRAILERQGMTARAQDTKIKALRQELASLKARNEDLEKTQTIEESLVVESFQEHYSSFSSSPSSPRLSSDGPMEHASQRSSGGSSFSVSHGYEGMPAPGFSSDWKMNAPDRHLKRKSNALNPATNFPIAVDRGGRPKFPVQTGPKRSRRAPMS